jgi:hypothetical protein
MSFLSYDYDDLARQVQHGLERVGISFLRAHGARMLRDVVDFHGNERIDLELSHDGHTLKIHQVGQPRGFEGAEGPVDLEEFESSFDGWPSENTAPEILAQWLAGLPAGEAPREAGRREVDATNPFASERPASTTRRAPDTSANPFLGERTEAPDSNPFAAGDREKQRQEMLRRLRGDS